MTYWADEDFYDEPRRDSAQSSWTHDSPGTARQGSTS